MVIWPRSLAREVMRSGWITDLFCLCGSQDLLTDETWGLRDREEPRMTPRDFGLGSRRMESPLTEIRRDREEQVWVKIKIRHVHSDNT